MRFVHDEGWQNLRKGLRAAVFVPFLYAVLGAAVGPTAALYAAFACFAALVFADFQGSVRRRLEGYAVLLVLGVVLVGVGSAVADVPVVPVVTIFVVTFVVRFVGCLGGYAIAAGSTLMLAFALSVMTTPVTHVDQRILGWVLGCVAAGMASLLAPIERKPVARDRLADQCRHLAAHLRARLAGIDAEPLDPTVVRQVREDLAESPNRPLTPTVGQTALSGLLDAVGRATLILSHLPRSPTISGGVADEAHLAEVAADAFDAAARVLVDGRAVDLTPAHDALETHRRRMLAVLAEGDEKRRGEVERMAAVTTRLRLVTALAAVAAADAAIWAGCRRADDSDADLGLDVPRGGGRAFWHRARRTMGFHLRWHSPRFRNSVRAGAALAISLLVARFVNFDHGFWVLLGTLMVLRSGMNDTAATAMQALRGTLIGFVIAVPLATSADGRDTLLWLLLPLVTFLAGWASGAIGLGTGQAAFTVFVVTLFNLAASEGVQTAVLRLETVATGIAVAVLSGFLFWPRGAQASVGPITARLYRASAATVRAISAEVLGLAGSDTGLARARAELLAAREQLDETLQELATDRRADVELTDRVAILTPPALVIAGDWARTNFGLGPPGDTERRDPDPALEAQVFEVDARFRAVADRLGDPSASVSDPTPTMGHPPPSSHDVQARQFLRLVWLWSWLTTLEESLVETGPDTVSTVRALPEHWWR